MGRREPAIEVMLSKDSISVCLGRSANGEEQGDGEDWYGMEAVDGEENRYTHCRATVYNHKATNGVCEIPARTGWVVDDIWVAKGSVEYAIGRDCC